MADVSIWLPTGISCSECGAILSRGAILRGVCCVCQAALTRLVLMLPSGAVYAPMPQA
jgi:hypothetical protein